MNLAELVKQKFQTEIETQTQNLEKKIKELKEKTNAEYKISDIQFNVASILHDAPDFWSEYNPMDRDSSEDFCFFYPDSNFVELNDEHFQDNEDYDNLDYLESFASSCKEYCQNNIYEITEKISNDIEEQIEKQTLNINLDNVGYFYTTPALIKEFLFEEGSNPTEEEIKEKGMAELEVQIRLFENWLAGNVYKVNYAYVALTDENDNNYEIKIKDYDTNNVEEVIIYGNTELASFKEKEISLLSKGE